MNEDIQADSWQHPQPYDWPDEEHPVGQLYLHLSAIVGGRSVLLQAGSFDDLDGDGCTVFSVSCT